MLQNLGRFLFALEGRVSRVPYCVTGVVLLVLKYAIDQSVAARFHEPWKIWSYFVPPSNLSVFGFGARQPNLHLELWAIAIPFFWIGIALTLRRLRDAGMRLGLVFLFFVPVANLFFFLYLCLVPSSDESQVLPDRQEVSRTSAVVTGTFLASAVGVLLVYFSANILARYAWGLFLGVPFVTGFLASWLLNAAGLQSRTKTVVVSAVVPVVIGMALLGFRAEGLVCLFMAIPLALPFSIAGGLAARYCLHTRPNPLRSGGMTACIACLPIFMLAENAADPHPPVWPVTTNIIIDAPASVVWNNVIAFPPLAPPKEWIFQTGIAYPTGAKIIGSGPGAVRHCQFSTGDFVEPITVWNPNHLLAFNVAAEPPSLKEIGFGPIYTPHVDQNYMRSQHGQFRLIAIDNRRTLLEGTTWYQDYFWPQVYWRAWSDEIVHRIHMRVLEHVKEESESQARESIQ
ncbi:MAG TPA: DUF805 domain-containing protein [Acidobacteriaceae bacterium]|nr:DUF805 domain-containing protein [Acidobacteriaceae bacterium]